MLFNNTHLLPLGLAEWALGEGSREKTKLTPWYEVLEPVHKKTKTIEATSSSSQDLSTLSKAIPSYLCEKTGSKTAAQLALDRELSRKRQEDPMAQYVKKYDHDHHLVKVVDERAERNYFEMNGFDGGQIEGKETFALEDQAEIKIPEGKKKHSRKESKHSRKSKQKEQEKRKDDSMQSVQITDDAVLLQQLRIKRLQREKEERKKTNVLLATSDIYGPVGSRSLPKPR
jgi:predicted nuclease of restriction endonuclease-like (RecB) superfamily